MTDKSIPEIVTQSEMRRHWWIYYQWEDVTELIDKEPKYLRSKPRPIGEAVEAANNFDTIWGACNAIDIEHERDSK